VVRSSPEQFATEAKETSMPAFVRVAAAFALLTAAALLGACGSDNGTGPSGGVTALQTLDLRVGTGAEAVNGKQLSVRYTGWLYDQRQPDNKGSQFDAGVFQFKLGAGAVIAGWDQGLVGVKVGGQRRLTIPPQLGYGSQGAGPIPPNASLVFDVELLAVS
jgi:FKBP-type peptidyl-prolyl cis-trans isomerase FkpA